MRVRGARVSARSSDLLRRTSFRRRCVAPRAWPSARTHCRSSTRLNRNSRPKEKEQKDNSGSSDGETKNTCESGATAEEDKTQRCQVPTRRGCHAVQCSAAPRASERCAAQRSAARRGAGREGGGRTNDCALARLVLVAQSGQNLDGGGIAGRWRCDTGRGRAARACVDRKSGRDECPRCRLLARRLCRLPGPSRSVAACRACHAFGACVGGPHLPPAMSATWTGSSSGRAMTPSTPLLAR